MEDRPNTSDDQSDPGSTKSDPPYINPEDDGRNKEWQDRARVNLEKTPEGTKTNLERDFEPEELDGDVEKDGGGEKY